MKASKFLPSDPISKIVLGSVAAMILIGCVFLVSGNMVLMIVGLLFNIAGLATLCTGYKPHPVKPFTMGLWTLWDQPIEKEERGKYYSVQGVAWTLPFFPFLLNTVPVIMTWVDKDFPMTIVSSDEQEMPGKVSVTAQADPERLFTFLRVCDANMDRLWAIIDEIIYRETQKGGREMDCLTITRQGEDLSAKLEKTINGHLIAMAKKEAERDPDAAGSPKDGFEQNSLGIIIQKVQVEFRPPKEFIQAMQSEKIQKLKRGGENALHETLAQAGEARVKVYEEHGEVVALKVAMEEVRTERLIDDGKVNRIEGSGVTLAEVKLNIENK